MRIRKSQSGFAAVELVLVVVILAAIVVAGWWVYNRQQTPANVADTTTTSSQSPVAHNVSTAPKIDSTSDLDNALTVLNDNDPAAANSSDSSQLSSQADF